MLTILERQLHLAEMGVPQWYSRLNLLGAAQSPDSVYLIADDPVMSEEQDSLCSNLVDGESFQPDMRDQGVVGSQGGVSGARDLLVSADLTLNQEGGEKKSDADKSLENSVASVQDESEVVLSNTGVKLVDPTFPVNDGVQVSALNKFSLNMYKVENYLIISECGHEGGVDAELSILKNILSVCTFISPLVVQQCQYEQSFHWPVFKSSSLQSKQDVPLTQVLKEWVAPFHGCDKGVLLYFGAKYEGVCKLIERDINEKSTSSCVQLSFKHSLSDLLRLPAGKADIWNVLSTCFLNGNNE